MQSSLPLLVCCVSLLYLQQLSASPARERPDGIRLNQPREPVAQEKEIPAPSEGQSNLVKTSSATVKLHKWLLSLVRNPPASGVRTESPSLTLAQPAEEFLIKRRAKRSRGHGHAHLKRVGCVLGTCQVQNLSHRLYQLIGQNGREDSSPINPRSPHSFG